jgi:hypothetical protein
MWLGVVIRMDSERQRHVFKRDWSTCSNTLIVLGSIVNMIRRDLYEKLIKHENLKN